jgi:hypothetical protein
VTAREERTELFMKNGCLMSSACFRLLFWILPFGSSAFVPSDALRRSSRSAAKWTRSKSWLEAFADETPTSGGCLQGVDTPRVVSDGRVSRFEDQGASTSWMHRGGKPHHPSSDTHRLCQQGIGILAVAESFADTSPSVALKHRIASPVSQQD